VFGATFRVGAYRGKLHPAQLGDWHGPAIATIHPSAVLRGQDSGQRDKLYQQLVGDLATAAREAARK
jgi:hypothetical protein